MKKDHLSKREIILIWTSIILVLGLLVYSIVDYSLSELKSNESNNNEYKNNIINYDKVLSKLENKRNSNIIIKCDCSGDIDYYTYQNNTCEEYSISKKEAAKIINKLGSASEVKELATSTECADYEFVFSTKNYEELIGGWTSNDNKSLLVGYKNKGYAFDFNEDITNVFEDIIENKSPNKRDDDIYVTKKPVLYLYPKKDNTKVTVTFKKPELLTTTYPKYEDKWEVTANKNGNLTDSKGNNYYALYWEDKSKTKVNFDEGYYVTKDNAIEFLEEKLKYIGLNDKERNEFIMYWLPVLEKNKKSIVHFELTESRQKNNELIITPTPDSLLRLSIHIKKVDKKPKKLEKQKLENFKRKGFVAVEWGGVNHKK